MSRYAHENEVNLKQVQDAQAYAGYAGQVGTQAAPGESCTYDESYVVEQLFTYHSPTPFSAALVHKYRCFETPTRRPNVRLLAAA